MVQQQIPYLVSGSFVGLGCMVVGGFFFWGHWLYRIYDQADLHHEEQQQILELIAASLMGRRAGASYQGSTQELPVGDWYAMMLGDGARPVGLRGRRANPDDWRVLGPDGLAGMRPCQICSQG